MEGLSHLTWGKTQKNDEVPIRKEHSAFCSIGPNKDKTEGVVKLFSIPLSYNLDNEAPQILQSMASIKGK
uniref:Uncharacterized protein n=1 Tax=Populus trichocarpa TaxID=3694 RepID=A0A2K2BQY1_POPTR